MEFPKLLLCIGVTLIITMNVCATENSKNDPDKTIPYDLTPIRYDIRLMPDIRESNISFRGEYNVSIEFHIVIHGIRVHLMEMKIDESATTLISTVDGGTYRPTNYTYDTKMDTVLITFEKELLPGIYGLHVKYSGNSPINPKNEFYRTSYTSNEYGRIWLAIMPFMPVSVTGLNFPCWGKPALTHSFIISIKHHRIFKALSNMPIRGQHTVEDDMMWTYFNSTPSMSSCFVAVALTDFIQVRNTSEINVWCSSNLISRMKYAQSIAEKVKEHMTQYTNISEQISKIDHIAIQNFSLDGLTHWELILYTESAITYDDTKDPTYRRRNVAKLIAHETSHLWFGGLVSPASLLYTWLSEGIATFFQTYILDKIYKDWRMIDFLVIDQLHESLSQDTGLIMNSIKPQIPSTHFNPLNKTTLAYSCIYNKSPVILRMLQHMITDEVFRNGIIIYLNTNLFKSATSDDLWNAMQVALNKSSIPHFKVKEVMDTWINQRHYPLVTVTQNYEIGKTIISQESFHVQAGNDSDNKWWVPITWTTQTNLDFFNTLPNHWLSPLNPNINLQINSNGWIIVNLQQTGYYRVNYDPTNWRKIAQYLNSEEYTKIHILNRAQIIDDAYALMMRKQFDISIFFELTNYLSRETDYAVWYVTFRNLAKLSKYFPLPESQVFKSHITKILDGLLRNVGYEEDPNEDDITKLRRFKVTKWACIVGNLECKRMATAKLDHHLADTDAHKILSWWQKWTYCSGLMTANRTTWDKTMNLYMQKRNKNLLGYLACSEDSDIIINYLNILASNNLTLKNKDHISTFKSVIIKHARNNLVLDYMLQNLERIKPESFTTIKMLENIIFNVYTKEQLDKIKNFVRNNLNEEISAKILPIVDSRLVALKNLLDNFPYNFAVRK